MTASHHERLSALDAAFLELEDESCPMPRGRRRHLRCRPARAVGGGPQLPGYLLGAPLRAAYPLVPLYKNQALGIALFSYDGGLFWSLNADWDALPDLHRLIEALAVDFEELRKAAGL